MFRKIGPGILVAAAFVGPGTITVCTLAGVQFGFALLWALLLSILTTMVLQEMAGRIGVLSQNGLVDVIKGMLRTKWIKNAIISIVLAAILLGNAAYEAGNIGGASLGLESIFGVQGQFPWYPLLIGFFAFIILWFGNYGTLEKVFVGLVSLMGFCFIVCACITRPSILEIAKGIFVPTLPQESVLTIVALVGTTVVPYNLFLHASLVKEKWHAPSDLSLARWDTIFAVGLGGLVSAAILITAAASPVQTVSNAVDMAKGIEPLFGKTALYFMGIGLLLAGITSAITAPLAAAYVASSCFGWERDMKSFKFRMVWISILALGVVSLSFNVTPLQIIQFAQIANGILLPVMALLLLWLVNSKSVVGKHTNTPVQNWFGALIVGFTVFLGVKSILKVFALL